MMEKALVFQKGLFEEKISFSKNFLMNWDFAEPPFESWKSKRYINNSVEPCDSTN